MPKYQFNSREEQDNFFREWQARKEQLQNQRAPQVRLPSTRHKPRQTEQEEYTIQLPSSLVSVIHPVLFTAGVATSAVVLIWRVFCLFAFLTLLSMVIAFFMS